MRKGNLTAAFPWITLTSLVIIFAWHNHLSQNVRNRLQVHSTPWLSLGAVQYAPPHLKKEGRPTPAASLTNTTPSAPVAADAEDTFVLRARSYLSSSSGHERLQQLMPFLVKLSAPNPIYIVQVGANTGYELNDARHSKDDPTVAGVKNPAARGVLIEPVPSNFAQLTANLRPYSDRFHCINAAVSTSTGGRSSASKIAFYTMNSTRVREEYRYAPAWFLEQLGSFDINHLKRHFVKKAWSPKHPKDYYITRTIVDALPPVAIIEKLYEKFPEARKTDGGDGISLLHVDAEGYDLKIVYAFLETTLPKAIVFEHIHLAQHEISESAYHMKKLGYAHWKYSRNTYAIYLGASASKVLRNE